MTLMVSLLVRLLKAFPTVELGPPLVFTINESDHWVIAPS